MCEGLLLLVTPAGGKFDGKEKLLSLGVYHDSSLKTAQERRDESGDSNEIFSLDRRRSTYYRN